MSINRLTRAAHAAGYALVPDEDVAERSREPFFVSAEAGSTTETAVAPERGDKTVRATFTAQQWFATWTGRATAS
jgi:hypothetical protein